MPSFTLFDLVLGAHKKLGTVRFSVSTAGTVNTLIDLAVASTGATPLGTDANKNGTLFVTQSTGASSAIAGQYRKISGFNPGTGTWTLSSALPSSGPNPTYYGYSTPEFPLELATELANDALRSLGPHVFADRSIVSSANQTVYSLSSAFKHSPPLQVDVMTGVGTSAADPGWVTLNEWDYQPSSAGAPASIVFNRELPASRDIRIWYEDFHHRVADSTALIDERIYPELAVLALVDKMYEYRNSLSRGATEYDIGRWQIAQQALAVAKATWPIPAKRRKSKPLVLGTTSPDHLPYVRPYGPA